MVRGELKSLRITLEETDSGVLGYVYLHEIPAGGSARQMEVVAGVIADFDGGGKLLGVEFLHAENATPQVMKELADTLTAPELAGIDLAKLCTNPTA